MNLDTTSKIIQIALGEAMVTANCPVVSSWADTSATTFALGNTNENTNGTSLVTVVGSPAASTQRQVKEIRMFNADTITHNVTLSLYDGTTNWVIGTGSVPIAPGQSFVYTPDSGTLGQEGPPGPASNLGPTIGWEAATAVYGGTFTYTQYAAQAGTVLSLRATVGGSGGSITATLNINGTPVTGINGVTVNSSGTQTFTATGANSYAIGATITLVLAIASGTPEGAVFTMVVS